jgi:LuxR family maltose regulon positive regulatory protein
MDISVPREEQLLITKLSIPSSPPKLLPRPRLTAQLNAAWNYKLMLISAAAGSGKTTLLASWAQSFSPTTHQHIAWISLDKGDNEPVRFWTYVLTALDMQQPEHFRSLVTYLQTQQEISLQYVQRSLINQLFQSQEQFILILDDYHIITQKEIHRSLTYLIEHLPPQLHIILATRTNPPLPLTRWRAHGNIQEIYGNQLCCTPGESTSFLHDIMGVELPEETLQQVVTHTAGWLVGLQLFALSLQGRNHLMNIPELIEHARGNQRYILDYLTEEVLQLQAPHVQQFLLQTSILERLNASLCDTVLQSQGSQQILEQLERANLFVVALDTQRSWYAYHALFAEALRYYMKQNQNTLIPILHQRASIWYAEHHYTTEAVLHAFAAHEWELAADLIERIPISVAWGAGRLRRWLEQLPEQVIRSRPRLCLACLQIMRAVAPLNMLTNWLDIAEASLTTATQEQASSMAADDAMRQEQQNLLGEIIAFRAFLRVQYGDDPEVFLLCQKALSLLPQDHIARSQVALTQFLAHYVSSANDAETAFHYGQQAIQLARKAGNPALAAFNLGIVVRYFMGTGHLHTIYTMTQQTLQQYTGDPPIPEIGWAMICQAHILCEWNMLDAALDMALQGIKLGKQTELLAFLLYAYSILLHIYLSRGELQKAQSTLQQINDIGKRMSPYLYTHISSLSTIVDRVRLWLASGEISQAIHWAERFDMEEQYYTPLAFERKGVTLARILLAQHQPAQALKKLEPLLHRATAGQRWGHVIEIRLLQALSYQQCQQEKNALHALAEAVRLAEPEGHIRCFVDAGSSMAILLACLRDQRRPYDKTLYLDRLLAAFSGQQQDQGELEASPAKTKQHSLPPLSPLPSTPSPLREPLSNREMEVLRLMERGAPNREIAQKLGITVTTVKRHVSSIFTRLDVNNRVQATIRARALGLLSDE